MLEGDPGFFGDFVKLDWPSRGCVVDLGFEKLAGPGWRSKLTPNDPDQRRTHDQCCTKNDPCLTSQCGSLCDSRVTRPAGGRSESDDPFGQNDEPRNERASVAPFYSTPARRQKAARAAGPVARLAAPPARPSSPTGPPAKIPVPAAIAMHHSTFIEEKEIGLDKAGEFATLPAPSGCISSKRPPRSRSDVAAAGPRLGDPHATGLPRCWRGERRRRPVLRPDEGRAASHGLSRRPAA